MSFTDLDRNLSTPPLSPNRYVESNGKRNPLSISTTSPTSNKNFLFSPVSPPVKLPNGIQVTRGSSRDSIGLNLKPQLQRHPHGQPYPPPVSPKRNSNNPLAQHSRFLDDDTRFDTPRPTMTPSDAATASSGRTEGAAAVIPRGPQVVSTSINQIRSLGNQRAEDQETELSPTPLVDSPHLTSPLSPPNIQYRGFLRADNQGPPDSGASNGNTNSNNDTIINIDNEARAPSPATTTMASASTSIHGPASWVSTSIQDQEHDYDLMVRHASQQIFNISSNIAVLERLIPCLGQRHKDTPEMRESLHAVLDGTQDLVKSAHGLIKALAKYHQPPPAAPQTKIGLRIQPSLSPNQLSSWQRKVLAGRRQTHQRLTKDLALASKSFQDLQRQALEAERRQIATLRRLSGSTSLQRLSQYRSDLMDLSQEEIEAGVFAVNSKNNGKAVKSGNSNASFVGVNHNRELSVQEEALLREILVLDGEVAFQESIIHEREIEIRKMEEGMGQVLDVMRELGTLVHEQRDGIDYLHDNIVQTRNRTQLAQQEVLKASEYQRRSREKLCYLLLITSIVGALVMLAFVST
ncbi:hypothetical protein BGZ65_001701 [Modicella reniformis]|uniref:t-SNARE coiled-coil homology domain-containing protein n=1 Tax=Modicella reniformis TaxID=1440133 RepID=A0A9P6M9U4_9FUNG|nr:hypothetical protein BGZ65_001701 [Modicella reniformis]